MINLQPTTRNLLLAHGAKQFTTHVLLPRLAIAHDALGRADDGDAHAVEDARQVADAAVDPPAGFGGAVQGVDDLVAAGRVLELDADRALPLVVDDVVLVDIA